MWQETNFEDIQILDLSETSKLVLESMLQHSSDQTILPILLERYRKFDLNLNTDPEAINEDEKDKDEENEDEENTDKEDDQEAMEEDEDKEKENEEEKDKDEEIEDEENKDKEDDQEDEKNEEMERREKRTRRVNPLHQTKYQSSPKNLRKNNLKRALLKAFMCLQRSHINFNEIFIKTYQEL